MPKSARKCQNLTFKVNFLYQKLSESFSILFSSKNINLGAHFLLLTFFDKIKIERLLFLKWRLIFDTSPLTQFSKFINFLWVCWFLGKNLSNFVPPVWKFHNPYCHIVQKGNNRNYLLSTYLPPLTISENQKLAPT